MKKRLVATLAFALALVMVLASCTTPSTPADSTETEKPAEQTQAPAGDDKAEETAPPAEEQGPYKKITINIGQELPAMNTIITTDANSGDIIRHIYEGLTSLDPNDKPIPGAAESWDISDDGLVYTFHLRDSVWSNGDPVTASDFAFAFERLLAPEVAAEYAYFLYCIKNGEKYNSGEAQAADLGINVIDPKTLEITLEQPTPYFLDMLAFSVCMPVNEAVYNQVGAEKYGAEAANAVYNGAYVMDAWEHEASVTLKKNPSYWNAAAINIDEIYCVMILDAQASFTAFLSGETDITGLANSDYIEQSEAQGYTTLTYTDGASAYFQFNVEDPIVKNQKIRQAFSAAIDRKAYLEKVMKNIYNQPALYFTHPCIKGVTKPSYGDELPADIRLSDNNPELAKQLFEEGCAELGIDPNGLKLTMITDEGDLTRLYMSALAESLKAVLGIELELDPMPFKSRLEKMTNKDFQIVFALWGPDYNDPMTFLDLWVTGGGNNQSGYTNPAYDALVQQALVTVDDAERYKLYFELEKIIIEDVPVAPLYFRYRTYTTNPRLTGVVRTAFQSLNLMYADVTE